MAKKLTISGLPGGATFNVYYNGVLQGPGGPAPASGTLEYTVTAGQYYIVLLVNGVEDLSTQSNTVTVNP